MSKSDFFCSICSRPKSILHPERHKCPPRWRVWWYDESETVYDPDEAWLVYARDQEMAAALFCDRDSDYDNWNAELMVEKVATGERFRVETEAAVVWRGISSERVN